jgi:DNA-binding MarR family transcriptional regulator
MELPFYLKTLEPLPGALDILRYFGMINAQTADADDIFQHLDISDRSFNKALRRLVTKGFVQMDGDMVYRLTDQGQRAVAELSSYQGDFDPASQSEILEAEDEPQRRQLLRRMVLVLPEPLIAEQMVRGFVGFHPAAPSEEADDTVEMVVRVSIVNGQPQTPQDLLFSLDDSAAQQLVEIEPGRYTHIRLRLEAFQLSDDPGEIFEAGGMYVDVPVTAGDDSDNRLAAFGIDITINA